MKKKLTINYSIDKDANLAGKIISFTTYCENLQEAKDIVATFEYVKS